MPIELIDVVHFIAWFAFLSIGLVSGVIGFILLYFFDMADNPDPLRLRVRDKEI